MCIRVIRGCSISFAVAVAWAVGIATWLTRHGGCRPAGAGPPGGLTAGPPAGGGVRAPPPDGATCTAFGFSEIRLPIQKREQHGRSAVPAAKAPASRRKRPNEAWRLVSSTRLRDRAAGMVLCPPCKWNGAVAPINCPECDWRRGRPVAAARPDGRSAEPPLDARRPPGCERCPDISIASARCG